MNLARAPTGLGEWRTATCKLSEDENKSLLNIYVDVRTSFHEHPDILLICFIFKETILYQTVYVHRLRHSDIRHADTSLFQRKDCIGIYRVAYVSLSHKFIHLLKRLTEGNGGTHHRPPSLSICNFLILRQAIYGYLS